MRILKIGARGCAAAMLVVCLPATARPATGAPASPGLITTVPFTLHDNRILVDVLLDGQGPFRMIFDTGGSNVLTPGVRSRLGSVVIAKGAVSGAGEDSVESGRVKVREMKLGEFSLTDQDFLVLDMDPIRKAFGFDELDGVIGYEVLERAGVRVDFDRQVLQILGGSAVIARAGALIRFELVSQRPVIPGMIEGMPADILVDTGDRSNLTIFPKFAAMSGLDSLFVNHDELVTGIGIGGPIPGRIATVGRVRLAGVEVDSVVARLPSTRTGLFATTTLSASAGLGLLRAFNLEFDYRHRVMRLEPRPGFHEPSAFVPLTTTPEK